MKGKADIRDYFDLNKIKTLLFYSPNSKYNGEKIGKFINVTDDSLKEPQNLVIYFEEYKRYYKILSPYLPEKALTAYLAISFYRGLVFCVDDLTILNLDEQESKLLQELGDIDADLLGSFLLDDYLTKLCDIFSKIIKFFTSISGKYDIGTSASIFEIVGLYLDDIYVKFSQPQDKIKHMDKYIIYDYIDIIRGEQKTRCLDVYFNALSQLNEKLSQEMKNAPSYTPTNNNNQKATQELQRY